MRLTRRTTLGLLAAPFIAGPAFAASGFPYAVLFARVECHTVSLVCAQSKAGEARAAAQKRRLKTRFSGSVCDTFIPRPEKGRISSLGNRKSTVMGPVESWDSMNQAALLTVLFASFAPAVLLVLGGVLGWPMVLFGGHLHDGGCLSG